MSLAYAGGTSSFFPSITSLLEGSQWCVGDCGLGVVWQRHSATQCEIDTDISTWRTTMCGYQGLLNTCAVHPADLRQGTVLESQTIRYRVLHTPHLVLYPTDGSERGVDMQWRTVSLYHPRKASQERVMLCLVLIRLFTAQTRSCGGPELSPWYRGTG